jgi:hypothetical protein
VKVWRRDVSDCSVRDRLYLIQDRREQTKVSVEFPISKIN